MNDCHLLHRQTVLEYLGTTCLLYILNINTNCHVTQVTEERQNAVAFVKLYIIFNHHEAECF